MSNKYLKTFKDMSIIKGEDLAMYQKSFSSNSLETNIKIAVIGPDFLVDKTLLLAANFPSTEFIPFPYTDYTLATEKFLEAEKLVDVVLFTGPLTQARVIAELHPNKPTICVQYDSSWLFPALYKAREQGFDIRQASVDAFNAGVVKQAYRELGVDAPNLQINVYTALSTVDEIIEFHLDSFYTHKSQVALTSIHSVYKALLAKGIPCFDVTPTTDLLYETLEKTYLLGESFKNRETQIVVGLIKLNLDKTDEAGDFEFQLQHLKLEVQKVILDYVQEIDGHLMTSGYNEYQFFTTRGLFERSTNWCTEFPLIEQINNRCHVSANAGVGFGRTANQAGNNAKLALNRSLEKGNGACFILLDNMRLIGPIISKHDAESYKLQTTNPSLVKVAEKVNVSAVTLERIREIAESKPDRVFSAYELEGRIGLTVRSIHRTINKLLTSGYLEVVGEVKTANKGRPRQIFRLKLPS